jgi:hypothetical protein
VEACITLVSSPSGPGTFRAAPLVKKDTGYQNSVRHLLNEELILLSKISDKTKDEELEKNQRLFDLRQDQTLDKDEKAKLLNELSNSMMSKQDLIDPGLNIATNSALDYIVFKTGNATKKYQRELKNMEKDALLDIEKKLDTTHINADLEAIEALNEDHKTILEQVCEREAVKLRNFKILDDEKPSKGMIELCGYTNVSMLYGPVETHAAPDIGSHIGEPEKNPRRKILIHPKEVRKFMTEHARHI